MEPKFSIITPVLHEADSIGAHVDHLRSLKGAETCEIIIVDGDPQQTTIGSIKDAGVITCGSKAGRAHQMNTGAACAQGDIIIFLHADTELPGEALDKISVVMKDKQYVSGAFDLGIHSDRLLLNIIARVASWRSRLTRIPYGDQALFFRRDYFHKIGGYKDIPLMEDVDLMQRIKRAGDKIYIIPDRAYSSPRRWEQEGTVYCTLRNWVLLSLYLLGVSPEALARYYRFGRRDHNGSIEEQS
jgi:rSAM/selenodomain-associated transferase 2